MFGFLGKLFGSSKAGEKLVDTVSNGLDKMFYTDQEKAEEGAKSRSEARGMFIRWMEATQGSNLARRLIALIVTSIWALQYTVSMILFSLAPWFEGKTELMNASATSLSSNGEAVTGAMMLILGFYFAAPHLGRIVEGAMSKFSTKTKKL